MKEQKQKGDLGNVFLRLGKASEKTAETGIFKLKAYTYIQIYIKKYIYIYVKRIKICHIECYSNESIFAYTYIHMCVFNSSINSNLAKTLETRFLFRFSREKK